MALLKLGSCLLFCLICNMTDWKTCKIRNRVALPFCVLGLLVNILQSGWDGGSASLIGGALMLCLIPLFALRMLGAGDIKALMGVGCMVGFPMALWALLYSLLGGGIIALLVLLRRRNGMARLKKLFHYLKGCCLTGMVTPYAEALDSRDGGFRFSFGITAGVSYLLFEQLFLQ